MTQSERLEAQEVRPVFAGWLDFKDDPAFGWTGPGVLAPSGTGDPILDGNLFSSAEGAVSITDFVENMGNGRPLTLTFSAPDTDTEIIRQIVRDRRVWQLRRAKIWLFFLMDDQASVHPEFAQLFSGVIVQANTNRRPDEPATIVLDLDTDLRAADGPEARLLDHARFHDADKFSTSILPLAQGPITSASGSSSTPTGRFPPRGGRRNFWPGDYQLP